MVRPARACALLALLCLPVPAQLGPSPGHVQKVQKLLERLTAGAAGFRLALGGLVDGAGFAAGPEYSRSGLAQGKLSLRASARASHKRYQLLDLQLSFPKLARQRMFAHLHVVHRNYPRINYYGPGPDSRKSGRSNFRLEDTAYDFTAGLQPLPRLKLGGMAGYLQVNTGPGTDHRFISAERIYAPSLAPGIDRQASFLHAGLLAQYDWRDNPGSPHRGGNYLARYTFYSDRALGLHSFRRLELEAQQYLPLFHPRHLLALRATSELSYARRGQLVPFYLQPVLGGSTDLRGFRPFRFYDDNLLALNAEHRWEAFSGLDLALFADAGKVFHRPAQWNLHRLEGAFGFGLRFHLRTDVLVRIDLGFSHEGYQLWIKFNNVF